MASSNTIPAPPSNQEIVNGERGVGGRWKKRVFARLIWQGMEPYAAFLRADYPVKGVNSRGGYSIESAQKRAAEMAESDWCREWIVSWAVDPKDQVKMAVPEAIAVLVEGLGDKKDGLPTALAVRCAENLLDRGGVIRSQKLQTEDTGGDPATQDAKVLIQMIRERLEAFENPVARPPALAALKGQP